MDDRSDRRRRDREWSREGVWDEAEELADEPPLPERVRNKVKRATREIGEDVSGEVEKLGGRLRKWSEDAGDKAEQLTRDVGSGLERVGRSGRRWSAGEGDEEEEDEYERALYDAERSPVEQRKRDEEEEWAREKKFRKKAAKDERKRRKRKVEEERERERLDRMRTKEGQRSLLDQEKAKPKVAVEKEERGWTSWIGNGWGRKNREKAAAEVEEALPEGRIGDVKFNGEVDVVCVDSSIASEQALRYALRNVPRGHSLLLVHGVYTPTGAVDSKFEDEKEMIRTRRKSMALCQQAGRRCAFRDFEFTTNNELGERVCAIAERQNAGTIILGRRASVSALRRAVLGSPSVSVMQRCDVPITLITEKKEGSLF